MRASSVPIPTGSRKPGESGVNSLAVLRGEWGKAEDRAAVTDGAGRRASGDHTPVLRVASCAPAERPRRERQSPPSRTPGPLSENRQGPAPPRRPACAGAPQSRSLVAARRSSGARRRDPGDLRGGAVQGHEVLGLRSKAASSELLPRRSYPAADEGPSHLAVLAWLEPRFPKVTNRCFVRRLLGPKLLFVQRQPRAGGRGQAEEWWARLCAGPKFMQVSPSPLLPPFSLKELGFPGLKT